MIKNFKSWLKFKESINNNNVRPKFKEREIWWSYFGTNVGFETDGKGHGSNRPIIVLRKYNQNQLLALPLSTQIKSGKYYFNFEFNSKPQAALLSQARVIDSKRLNRIMGRISVEKYLEIKNTYIESL